MKKCFLSSLHYPFIQKQRPLLFPLLAHSRHSKQSSFPAENIKTTEKIH